MSGILFFIFASCHPLTAYFHCLWGTNLLYSEIFADYVKAQYNADAFCLSACQYSILKSGLGLVEHL